VSQTQRQHKKPIAFWGMLSSDMQAKKEYRQFFYFYCWAADSEA
jgi:hypothetical protein